MSDAPELLPCPFCGGKATWAYGSRGWKVECEGRFGSCAMNARTHYQPVKDMAVAAWNRRATPAALAASPEVQAMIREAEVQLVDRACLAVSEQADWPEDEHGRTEQPELFARVINAIRAEAAALKGETK